MIWMHTTILPFFSENRSEEAIFASVMALAGTVYRDQENRRTQRIVHGENRWFLKTHRGVGWKEILINLMQLRLPVLGARHEWRAIQRLNDLAIPTLTVLAYGERGWHPAYRQSFLLTRELPPSISLEELVQQMPMRPISFRLKKQLILQVAQIAQTLHRHGVNHRDFYLCHFLLDLASLNLFETSQATSAKLVLYVIDLHRAGVRKKTALRWIIKDLAGLYFSGHDAGLTQRDYLRFMRAYQGSETIHFSQKERIFWQKVKKRGDKLYARHAN